MSTIFTKNFNVNSHMKFSNKKNAPQNFSLTFRKKTMSKLVWQYCRKPKTIFWIKVYVFFNFLSYLNHTYTQNKKNLLQCKNIKIHIFLQRAILISLHKNNAIFIINQWFMNINIRFKSHILHLRRTERQPCCLFFFYGRENLFFCIW